MTAHSPDLHRNAGAAPRWFLSTLTWIRGDAASTEDRLSLVEQLIPAGFESPWHLHHTEDESFYVLEGKMTVIVGEKRKTLNTGDFAFGPKGVPHGFRIEGDTPARILLITSGGGFASFVSEMSEPAPETVLPPETPMDVPALIAAAGKQQIEILGVLPA
jgi:quercetin dioxygenase-like cupin family protein